MTHFKNQEDIWTIVRDPNTNVTEALPGGIYLLNSNMQLGLYLEELPLFEMPDRIYGDVDDTQDRILTSFADRPFGTGVLLNGEKGSGKTLLAKSICNELARHGLPTILINSPYCGDDFSVFLNDINQPCVVLFDEFEKVYNEWEAQKQLLTILDGVFKTKKLFLFTVNKSSTLDDNMDNRPGRIYYTKRFAGLSREAIEEYCQDCLVDKQYVDEVVKVSFFFRHFTFDMLVALVEEMNRFNESPKEALKLLNVSPTSYNSDFNIKFAIEGIAVEKGRLEDAKWRGNPLSDNVYVEWWTGSQEELEKLNKGEIDEEQVKGEWKSHRFNSNDISTLDAEKGEYHYDVNGMKLTLTKTFVYNKTAYDWFD